MRRATTLVLGAVLVAVLALLASPALANAATGSIAGTVTAAVGGARLSGISVTVYSDSSGSWNEVGSASTDASGTYGIGGLDAGTYRVEFSDGSGTYLDEYYDAKAAIGTATDVEVTAGATTGGIDAALRTAGHITGTVTAATGGAKLSGIWVTVYRYSSGYWSSVRSASTDANGAYNVGGLYPGTYRVAFSDGSGDYLDEYYDAKADIDTATDVAVTAGATTSGIDAALRAAGHITGTVTAATGGEKLSGISVSVYIYSDGYWSSVGWASTDANGAYNVGGLYPGTYRVGFGDGSGDYVSEYYNAKADVSTATDVAVTAGATTSGIDAALRTAGRITGTVTAATGGAKLAGISVGVYRYSSGSWNPVRWASTDANGAYNIGGLYPGTYRVGFGDGSGDYVSEYYNAKADIDTATDVAVTAGATTSGIDAALRAAGHITGTVTAATGGGELPGVTVTVYRYSGGYWASVSWASTDASGTYDVGGLYPGTYRVGFSGSGDYVSEYYNAKADVSTATDVAVTAGSTTSGIDAALRAAGHITGTVTAASDGGELPGIRVSVYRYSGGYWSSVRWTSTDTNGAYKVGGLDPGTYRVAFSDDSGTHIGEYYNAAADLSTATEVEVSAGSTTSGIDAALQTRTTGSIAGTITAATGGAKLSGISVSVYSFSSGWGFVRSVYSDANGAYVVGGLDPGTYRVQFYDGSGTHLGEYYSDKADIDTATDVEVTAGATTGGIDAALRTAGHITGTLTAATGGAKLSGIRVSVYSYSNGNADSVRSVYSDANGAYDVGGLDTGTYRVQFYDGSGARLGEYYSAKTDIDTATDVAVTAGATTSGIDAALRAAGHITGTVTAATGGEKLSGISVSVYIYSDGYWSSVGWASTDANGAYSVGGLYPGTYRVGFGDGSGARLGEYYNAKADIDTATDVAVTAGATKSGIDAALRTAGQIAGTVTAAAGGAKLAGISVSVYSYSGGSWNEVAWASTDASGSYDAGGLDTGTYRVAFSDYSGTHLGEYYNAKADVSTATDVVVTAGSTTSGIDAALRAAGHITGTVTAATDGAKLSDIDVNVYHYSSGSWICVNGASTDASGTYDVSGLDTGTYRVAFSDYSGTHLGEYYDAKADIDTATDVTVTAGATTSGIDAALRAAGHITGTVTAATDGAKLSDIDVNVYHYSSGSWNWVNGASTDASGTYDVSGLDTGTYRVWFSNESGTYADEYYDAEADISAATDVAVTAGATTSGIDAALRTAGHITGTVTAASGGARLADIWVTVYRYSSGSWNSVRWASTEASGTYDAGGLGTGTYRLQFSDGSGTYAGEYYDTKADISAATDIAVTAGATTSGIDAALGALAPDGYEADDTSATAKPIVVNAPAQPHTLCPTGDSDWMWFDPSAGTTYDIETHSPSSDTYQTDTYLELYGADGTTLLVENDDSDMSTTFSKVTFTASSSSRLLVRVRGADPLTTGAYLVDVTADVAAPGTCTVTFSGNGGLPASTVATTTYNTALGAGKMPTNPTRSGYSFASWNTAANGSGTAFTSSTAVPVDITVYAQWTINVQTVTFSGNGGLPASTVATTTYNTALGAGKMPTNPTRTGYSFASWNTAANGSGTAFTSSTAVPVDITVYAQWTINVQTVTFSGNGGLPASTVATTTYNTALGAGKMPTNPTRTGYSFASWNTAANGSGTAFTSSTAVPVDITVYAQWTINVQTVTFSGNGGLPASTVATTTYNTALGAGKMPTNPTRSGYSFASWNTAANGSGTAFTSSTAVPVDITVYAQWTINVQTVTFSGNGGLPASTVATTTYNTALGAGKMPTNPTRSGYSFASWNTAANGSGTAFTSSTAVPVDITVYAQWTINVQTVTFSGNGGLPASTVATTTYNTALGAGKMPTNPTRSGYSFASWNTAANGSGTAFTSSTAVPVDITVYAQWTINVQTVTFSGNGGLPASTVATTTYNTALGAGKMPTNPTRSGYSFASWNTAANGSGTAFTSSTAVPVDITVYAQWTINVQTVTFSGNGGLPASTVATTTYNTALGAGKMPTNPTRSGYSFASWNTAANGSGTAFTSSTAVPVDITVYAQWTINVQTVTFSGNGGLPASTVATTTYNTALGAGKMPTNPTRSGYSFASWNTAANGSGTAFTSSTAVPVDITVYAQWTINVQTVTFSGNGGLPASTVATTTYNTALGAGKMPTNPTRSGYSFASWNTAANGSGTAFTSSTAVPVDITVYAQWTINVQTVTFSGNGGLPASTVATTTYNTALGAGKMPTNPTRSGYSFASWNTAANGSGTAFTSSTAVPVDITVYAQWTINVQTVTFSGNGGLPASTVATTTYNTALGAGKMPTNPTRSGYSFASWNTAANGSGTAFTSSTAVPVDITVYAQWTINSYTITPATDANGTASPATAQTVNWGGSATFLFAPKADHHLADVFMDGISIGASSSVTFANVQANHTISAIFAPDVVGGCTISATAGPNGTISPSGISTMAVGASRTFSITPDTGYRVADVLVDGDSVGAVSTHEFTNVQTDRTIQATFAINTYTVTFNGNNGLPASATTTTTYNTALGSSKMPTNPTRSGYSFASWNTAANGSGTGFTSSTAVLADITVYAQWTINYIPPSGPQSTSITIKTSATTTSIGKTPVLSGSITPGGMVGKIIVVWVKKPGKRFWTYSSNRGVFATGGAGGWSYKYFFKKGMTKGIYYFKASIPAYEGYAPSTSPTTVSIRVK